MKNVVAHKQKNTVWTMLNFNPRK